MLKFKLGKVIGFAYQDQETLLKAKDQFFGKVEFYEGMENLENIIGLFNEWLIFEFDKKGSTFVQKYYLKNPDNLSKGLLDELKQILETQFFDIFEVQEIMPGKGLRLYSISRGKNYDVIEINASLTIPSKGSMTGRLARVNRNWYLVGSNPQFLPMRYTARAKKGFLRNGKNQSFSAKDFLRFLLPDEEEAVDKPDPLTLTPKQMKAKRKKIEKKFKQLAQKYQFKTTFEQVVNFVYKEKYRTNHADFYKDLSKIGIPGEVVVKHTQLFVDLWNYFPHQSLGGKAPAERYREAYG